MRLIFKFILLLLVIHAPFEVAQSQKLKNSKSPYTTTLKGRTKKLNSYFDKLAKRFQVNTDKTINIIKDAKFNARVVGLGNVKIKFTTAKSPNWNATFTHSDGTPYNDLSKLIILKGELTSRRIKTKLKIVATVSEDNNNIRKIMIHLPIALSKGRRLYTLNAKINPRDKFIKSKLRIAPKSGLNGRTCESEHVGKNIEEFNTEKIENHTHHHSGHSHTSKSSLQIAEATATQIATIATDADFPFYKRYGKQSNVVIAGLVEFASDTFSRDFGLKFRITKQNVFTSEKASPYTNTVEALELLRAFQKHTLSKKHIGDADLFHLFTGQDLKGSTIGLAYSPSFGVVCRKAFNQEFTSYNFALTQDFARAPIINGTTLTHEIGHNFSSPHDEKGSTEFIMSAQIKIPPPKNFSSASLSKIKDNISKLKCFDLIGRPKPTPTRKPTPKPTKKPTNTPVPPTQIPTKKPTNTPRPTNTPTKIPTAVPTPTNRPTVQPTATITDVPTPRPTQLPTATSTSTPRPTLVPTLLPTPTVVPTSIPTKLPTAKPTIIVVPTLNPDGDKISNNIRRFRFRARASRSGSIRLSLRARFNDEVKKQCKVAISNSISNTPLVSFDLTGKSFSASLRAKPTVVVDDKVTITATTDCQDNAGPLFRASREIPMLGRKPRGTIDAPKTKESWLDSFLKSMTAKSRRRTRKRRANR